MEEMKDPKLWCAKLALTNSGNKHGIKRISDECRLKKWAEIKIGRMDFGQIFAEDFKIYKYDRVHVYCQGGAVLQTVVEKKCTSLFRNVHYNPAQHNI